jgi:hypothetical protein
MYSMVMLGWVTIYKKRVAAPVERRNAQQRVCGEIVLESTPLMNVVPYLFYSLYFIRSLRSVFSGIVPLCVHFVLPVLPKLFLLVASILNTTFLSSHRNSKEK